MKRFILMLSYFTTLLGWFPFMWVAVWSSWNRDVAVIVLCIGLFCCLMGSIFTVFIIRSKDLFSSIEELDKEREKLIRSREKYNAAALNLIAKYNTEACLEKQSETKNVEE